MIEAANGNNSGYGPLSLVAITIEAYNPHVRSLREEIHYEPT